MTTAEYNCNHKKKYLSRQEARKFKEWAIARHKKKFKVYKCNICGKYHLTKEVKDG
jgi:hypothetical protein